MMIQEKYEKVEKRHKTIPASPDGNHIDRVMTQR